MSRCMVDGYSLVTEVDPCRWSTEGGIVLGGIVVSELTVVVNIVVPSVRSVVVVSGTVVLGYPRLVGISVTTVVPSGVVAARIVVPASVTVVLYSAVVSAGIVLVSRKEVVSR